MKTFPKMKIFVFENFGYFLMAALLLQPICYQKSINYMESFFLQSFFYRFIRTRTFNFLIKYQVNIFFVIKTETEITEITYIDFF